MPFKFPLIKISSSGNTMVVLLDIRSFTIWSLTMVASVCDVSLNPDNNCSESSALVLATLHLHSSRIVSFLLVRSIGTNMQETSKISTTKDRALKEEKH